MSFKENHETLLKEIKDSLNKYGQRCHVMSKESLYMRNNISPYVNLYIDGGPHSGTTCPGKEKGTRGRRGARHSGNIYPLHSFILTKFHVENSWNDLNF